MALIAFIFGLCITLCGSEVINLWPGNPPGPVVNLPPEADQTKPEDRLIAGRRIIKLGNVTVPQIEIFQPESGKRTDSAVVIAPGGGHYILAWDLEGTEVAEWFNSLGMTAIVLKYRVPSRTPEGKRWMAAVQDAQRAMSLVRSMARDLQIDPHKIGILGFSAGGQTAALTALLRERQYEPVDKVDEVSFRPDFAAPIYSGGLVPQSTYQAGEAFAPMLAEEVVVTPNAPPFFMAHAHDDNVTSLNSALLYIQLKKAGVSAELHVFESGGHGYGLRRTEKPVTSWPEYLANWLRQLKWIE